MVAFTLAEVLITIGVIGVVAAMTIPTLINKYQVAVIENSVKKTYSLLVNAFRMELADTDCSDLMCTGLFPEDTDDVATYNEKMKMFVSKRLSGASFCEVGDVEKCPGHVASIYNGGTTFKFFKASEKRFVIKLNNGVFVSIDNMGCEPTNPEYNSKLEYSCGKVFVDINGEAKPNVGGKDVFQFGVINSNGYMYPPTSLEWSKAQGPTLPNYWRNTPSQCGIPGKKFKEYNGSMFGMNCLSRIMENNWKIDYL